MNIFWMIELLRGYWNAGRYFRDVQLNINTPYVPPHLLHTVHTSKLLFYFFFPWSPPFWIISGHVPGLAVTCFRSLYFVFFFDTEDGVFCLIWCQHLFPPVTEVTCYLDHSRFYKWCTLFLDHLKLSCWRFTGILYT